MPRVDLPSENWADFRDADTIRKKDRDRVLTAMDNVEGAMAQVIRAADMTLALAIEKWSFDAPIPSENLASLDELSIPDYDALCAAADPWQRILFPDFKGNPVDPKAPQAS